MYFNIDIIEKLNIKQNNNNLYHEFLLDKVNSKFVYKTT